MIRQMSNTITRTIVGADSDLDERQEALMRKVTFMLRQNLTKVQLRRLQVRMFQCEQACTVLAVGTMGLTVVINELCWEDGITMKGKCEVPGLNVLKMATTVLCVLETILILNHHQIRHDYMFLNEDEQIVHHSALPSWIADLFLNTRTARRNRTLILELLLTLIHPVPFTSFLVSGETYIFGIGSTEYELLFESVICVFTFLRLYHLGRLFRYWTVHRLYWMPTSHRKYLEYEEGSLSLLPNETTFAIKVALADYPVRTLGTLFAVFLLTFSYCLRIAEGYYSILKLHLIYF